MALSETDIQQLIKACQTGDKNAFEPIFHQFIDKIFRYVLFRIGGDHEEAKDVTAEVFTQAYFSLPTYRANPEVRFSAWLYAIARHLIASYHRHRQRHPRATLSESAWANIADTQPDELLGVIQVEEFDLIIQHIPNLPPVTQEIINLKFSEGLNHEEIAHIIGKSAGHTRLLLHRGLKQLRKLIDESL